MIPVGGTLRLQSPARGRETVGVLELAREVSAVGKPRLIRDVRHRTVGILDQPVGVTHAQLPVERGWTHANVLTAESLELACGEPMFGRYHRDCDRACEI